MTLHLPGDGWIFLTRVLTSPIALGVVGLAVVLLPLARTETVPLRFDGPFERGLPGRPSGVQVGAALVVAVGLEGLLPSGPWWGLSGLDLLARNLLVLLVGFDLLPRLVTGNPFTLRQMTGRLRPPVRLSLCGLGALILTGLGLWGLTAWFPITVRVGSPALDGGASVAGGILLQVLFIPLTEEWIFRGGIYRWLRGWSGPGGAVLLSAGLFALLHGTGGPWLYTLAGGLVMAGLMEGTGSILPGFVVHAGMNFLLLYGGLLLT